jgi:hypothetical protein
LQLDVLIGALRDGPIVVHAVCGCKESEFNLLKAAVISRSRWDAGGVPKFSAKSAKSVAPKNDYLRSMELALETSHSNGMVCWLLATDFADFADEKRRT